MDKKIVYMLGAGASYHALPVVSILYERFETFCNHILSFNQFYYSSHYQRLKTVIPNLLKNISAHYTIDTYARKLYLKNPELHTNPEYIQLINFLSAYFLYEQLQIDINERSNAPLKNLYERSKDVNNPIDKSFLNELDYRYDSFFATILNNTSDGKLVIPSNFSIISWNYDFQVEKAFMNFSGDSLETTLDKFKVVGINHQVIDDDKKTFLTKLNGTAAFAKKGKYTNLFEFKKHSLNKDTIEIISKILSDERTEYDTGMRFAWEKNDLSKSAVLYAQRKISEAEIIVIIGYSFPYFNRKIDRLLFERVGTLGPLPKIYIQCAESDIKSVMNRFKGINGTTPIPFVELDQFLIPNEL